MIDVSSPEELERIARELIEGFTVGEVANMAYSGDSKMMENARNKGDIGLLIEKVLGIDPNSAQRPDFEALGIELKVTPVEATKKGVWRAGERLVITMISYKKEENEIGGRRKTYEESHVGQKLAKILLCDYQRPANHTKLENYDRNNNRIVRVGLFSVPEEDLPAVKRDWAKIMDYVYAGRAQELSESLTDYLGACTKGADSSKLVIQGYPPYAPAKPRAFCLKQSYMTYLQNNYVLKDRKAEEPKIGGDDFETLALRRMHLYVGKTDAEIADLVGFDMEKNAKDKWARLSFAMMGVKSNSCEEFEKANIVMKTLRFEPSGSLRESISLPVQDFLSVLQERDFEDSALYEYFYGTRFLLSIWQKEDVQGDEVCRFVGAAFWGMNAKDIYGPLQECWKLTKSKLMHGVKLVPKYDQNGKVSVSNDLPGKSTPGSIAHVRPHTARAFHLIRGKVYLNDPKASTSNAFQLPNGDWMTKQSFWLNNDYMVDVVKSLGIKV